MLLAPLIKSGLLFLLHRFADAAAALAGPDWPLDPQFLRQELRLLYDRRTGKNKLKGSLRIAQTSQSNGPEAISVHITTARERILQLNKLEEQWVAFVQGQFPSTAEPQPVRLPPYAATDHREFAKLWRTRHLKSWERGVVMPALLPELPEEVCFYYAQCVHSL
jgi:hypothetical protein